MILKKINKDNYLLLDDSNVKTDDIVLIGSNKIGKVLRSFQRGGETNYHVLVGGLTPISSTNCKKIIASTHPIESRLKSDVIIEPLSLSDIESLLGYNVESIVESYCEEQDRLGEPVDYNSYIKGFKDRGELSKHKLFTIDDMMKISQAAFVIKPNYETIIEDFESWFDKRIESLQPDQWEVEFIDGKLNLVEN